MPENLGMIFQSYSLWPHMTVRENVAFPLKRRGFAHKDVRPFVDAALELVRCGTLADHYPGQLSGGQQQRVALARAIVPEPAVLLFDEPLSNLDANLRRQLRDEIAALHNRLSFSGIYVTHDQAEALSLGTSVAVMKSAQIEQIGSPQEVHNNPVSEYVAWFLGSNVFDATVDSRGVVETPFGVLASEKAIGKGAGPRVGLPGTPADRGGGKRGGASHPGAIQGHCNRIHGPCGRCFGQCRDRHR